MADRIGAVGGQLAVHTEAGHHVIARYVIAASGALDATNIPDFPGLESFQGEWHHTSMWPKEKVDFTGKRVGVIVSGGNVDLQRFASLVSGAQS